MTAGVTFTPLATYTFASAAASYTFSSISTAYTDLILMGTFQAGATNYDIQVGNGSAESFAIVTTGYI